MKNEIVIKVGGKPVPVYSSSSSNNKRNIKGKLVFLMLYEKQDCYHIQNIKFLGHSYYNIQC